MSEAATRWISPFWGTLRTASGEEAGEKIASAQVFVLNLGEQAKLTVNWYYANKVLAYHDESNHNSHTVIESSPEEDDDVKGYGWLRIISASPVLPWGITPAWPTTGARDYLPPPPTPPPGTPILWVPMVFYREDPIEIPKLDIPIG